MKYLPALLLLGLAACVELPPSGLPEEPRSRAIESPYEGLDPGSKDQETAHFKVAAYTSPAAALYSGLCEENYTRIMQDLGLYSFVPARPYNVVVYKDAAEFHRKTGQPEWSGGAAYGNALLLYENDSNRGIIAHEMTHLVFNEFMGLSQAAQLRWLNEGVAVYEEMRADRDSAGAYAARLNASVLSNPIPFSQMVNLAPQAEARRTVDRWYAQVGSVVSFMIRNGGSFNFSLFLGALRRGADTDRALAEAYPNGWHTLAEVEKAWKLEVLR